MSPSTRIKLCLPIYVLAVALPAIEIVVACEIPASSQTDHQTVITTPDTAGDLQTIFTNDGSFDKSNPFFASLGTNGRSCGTCHLPGDAWSITPKTAQKVFNDTKGLDPLFAPVDGTNSPNADLSSIESRRRASSMLLTKGLIRVGIGIPAGAEFTLSAVDDPYGFAGPGQLSLFRRPLPSANLGFLSAVMWDGRETIVKMLPGNTAEQNFTNLVADLTSQAVDATTGHAQAESPPTAAQLQQIVSFELAISSAQITDHGAGRLDMNGALGGPTNLAEQPFYIGLNDVLGADPITHTFNSSSMLQFAAWQTSSDPQRRSIARGEALFNTKPISITGVGGLNDALGVAVIPGTCTSCHDTPNVGDHSVSLPIDIGLTDANRRTADQPLYTLRNVATGQLRQTTDPGRALISGKWADIGKFKGPILHGLAARAPYFHNGSAATLEEVVDFYQTRFGLTFTAQEQKDLVAFLKAI